MVLPIDASTIARATDALTAALADGVIKGTLVLLLAGCAAMALRGAAAATRHLVWVLAVGALLLLPALALVAPKWQVPLPIDLGLSIPTWTSPAVPAVAEPQVAAAAARVPGPRAPRVHAGRARTPHAMVYASAPASDRVVPSEGPPLAGIPAADPVPGVRGPLGWRTWLAFAWLGGATVILTAVVASLCGIRRLERAATELTTGRAVRLTQLLAGQLGLRAPVRVLRGGSSAMPMTWGTFEPAILLPAGAEAWPQDRLRAVLLHELAHVRRRDYLTQMAARFVGALYWYHPLVWLALRRLRVERELACDDVVLSAGAKPSVYAGHLLEIARGLQASRLASVASVAMARPSQLSGRLLAVLDATRPRRRVMPRVAVPALVVTAAVMFPMAGATLGSAAEMEAWVGPAPVALAGVTLAGADPDSPRVPSHATALADRREQGAACRWGASGGRSAASVAIEEGEMHIRIRQDDCWLEVDANGALVFDEAEADIVSIAEGGYFEIEERDGREVRRLEVRPTGGGELQRRWLVNGEQRWTVTGDIRGHDAEASAWLARLLPVVFRRTGFQAVERAQRILARAGVRGVLDEVAEIPSDYAARKYLTVLLGRSDLEPGQVREIVQLAGRQIDSDYELAELLIAVARDQQADDLVRTAYVEATATIESDYEHRRALAAILARQGLGRELAIAMLQQAASIGSDYELAELLIDLLRARPLEDTLAPAFFAAVNTIASDYEQGRVLQYAFARGVPEPSVLDRALESAIAIDSDHELAELLIELARRYPHDRALPVSYVAAAETLDSDHEAGRVWTTLVERDDLAPDAVAVLLAAAARSIESDWELANLLVNVVSRHALDDHTVAAFFRALASVQSDTEHGRVLQALLDRGSLHAGIVSAMLESALEIQSDFELANVLVGVADAFPIDAALRPAYERAARSIGSRYERDRALTAVGRATP